MAGLNPLYPAPDKWRPGDNLLDNACFLNVVNQRGEREYMGVVYGIDRWIGLDTRTIVSVEDGYVKVSASDGADSLWAIRQAVKPEARNFLKNRLATVSVLSTKGLVSLTSDKFFVSDISKQSQNEDGLAVWVNADSVLIAFMSGGKSELIAAMLEPGPEQHLAHKEGGKWVLNRVPDFREELAKCQTYQIIENKPCNGILGRVEGDEKSIVAFIPTPVTPRANGTFSISSANIVGNGTWAHLSNAYGTATAEAGGVSIMITGDFSSFGPFHLVNMWIENGYSLDFNL